MFPPLLPSAFLVGLARAVVAAGVEATTLVAVVRNRAVEEAVIEATTLLVVTLVLPAWLLLILVSLTVVVPIAVLLLAFMAIFVDADVDMYATVSSALVLLGVEVAALVELEEDPAPALRVPNIGDVSHW